MPYDPTDKLKIQTEIRDHGGTGISQTVYRLHRALPCETVLRGRLSVVEQYPPMSAQTPL